MNHCIKWLLQGVVCVFFLVSALQAGETGKAAIFVSDPIKPYHEAAQGIESVLKNHAVDMELVDIKDLEESDFSALCLDLLARGYTFWIGIGPSAMQQVLSYENPLVAARVFCMVLDPGKNVPRTVDLCGVSLQIPVSAQVDEITSTFSPDIHPGLIFDPLHNKDFAAQAAKRFEQNGIVLQLLEVNSRSDVPGIFENGIKQIDLLWMIPDHTVITESLIRYMIKDAIKQGVGVVGYNSFFLRQGAAAAFVIDYEAVGRQAASLLLDSMENRPCRVEPPVFEFSTNKDIMMMLELSPHQQEVYGDDDPDK